jgi:hypothetical protein
MLMVCLFQVFDSLQLDFDLGTNNNQTSILRGFVQSSGQIIGKIVDTFQI